MSENPRADPAHDESQETGMRSPGDAASTSSLPLVSNTPNVLDISRFYNEKYK